MRHITNISVYMNETLSKYPRKSLRTFCGHECFLYKKGEDDYILVIPDNVIALNQPYMEQGELVFTRALQFLRGCIKVVGGAGLATATRMFNDCKMITELNLFDFNTSNLRDMSGMFQYCPFLRKLNLKGLDLSKVENMQYAFLGCWRLESIDITGINTINCMNMSHLFDSCSSLTAIEGLADLKTGNVVDMTHMFSGCTSLKNINLSQFNTHSVVNMAGMFYNCKSLGSIDAHSFVTYNVQSMEYIFSGCTSLVRLDISNFDTPYVVSILHNAFVGCNKLREVDMSMLSLFGDQSQIELAVNVMFNPGVIRYIKVRPEYAKLFSRIYSMAKVA